PDILVNNAGLQRRAPLYEFAPADWDEIVDVNLSSVFYVSRWIIPGMVERGAGKIVNIGSVQSLLARETIAPYSATKGAVAQLTKGMAADLARHNIQVNTISPGYFATDMNRALVDDPDFSNWLAQRTPARRWGAPEELSGALLFLCSEASSFISGQNLFVDGGMTAGVCDGLDADQSARHRRGADSSCPCRGGARAQDRPGQTASAPRGHLRIGSPLLRRRRERRVRGP